jgi:hypothetical protein
MSKTALKIRESGRVAPLRENKAIRLLRTGTKLAREGIIDALIDPEYERVWNEERLADSYAFALFTVPQEAPRLIGEFRSCNVVSLGGKIWAVPRYLGKVELDDPRRPWDPRIRHADTIEAAMAAITQGEDEARRLFGEGAKCDIVECNNEWMAIPHSIGLTDVAGLASLQSHGVLKATSREELVFLVLRTRLGEMGTAGADLLRVLDEWRASPASPRALADAASTAADGASEQSSVADISARLGEIAAVTQALASRVDRISAISEQALLATADLHHRFAAGVASNPPRQFGVLRWSLRQPRKAARAVLNRLRTFLKPIAEPRKRAASATIAPSNKSAARI